MALAPPRRGPSRSVALNAALRSAIESYIVSVADRAAEAVEGSWRADPAGAVLLADAAAERARDVRAKQVFESVFGPAGQSGAGDLADMDIKTADVFNAADAAKSSAFGAVTLTEILAKARASLTERVRLLLDEELVRFVEVIDAAGDCDDVAAIRVYQAEFSLEAVR